MNLIAYISQKDAERDLHYCPCCKDRLAADDMDLSRSWDHSDAMRAKYGSACCNGCTDTHFITDDGVLVSDDDDVWRGSDGTYSSADALEAARAEGRIEAADQAMCRGWL